MHAVRAELVLRLSRQLLPRHSPVRSQAADVVAEIHSVSWLGCSNVRGSEEGRVGIQMVVPHAVATETSDILAQTGDDGRSRGSRRKIIRHERVAPCQCAIPKIFYGGIVVEVQTEYEFLTANRGLIRVPDVCVIHAEVIVLRVVSHLHETAHVRGPCAGKK